MKNLQFCNNCGKLGHLFHQCKIPITSIGIILFRKNSEKQCLEYLLIRRKDSLGFVDFMRGKYQLNNNEYILTLLNNMSLQERSNIKNGTFKDLWDHLWGDSIGIQYKNEEKSSNEKFNLLKDGIYNIKNNNRDNPDNKDYPDSQENFYNLDSLIETCHKLYNEAEWGFPKGRRNYGEKDLSCALREFEEETGYNKNNIKIIHNILPVEEIFSGSNFKSYKHKYFLAYVDERLEAEFSFQNTEVSKIAWKTFEDLNLCIRPYNLEKINLIKQVNKLLSKYNLYS